MIFGRLFTVTSPRLQRLCLPACTGCYYGTAELIHGHPPVSVPVRLRAASTEEVRFLYLKHSSLRVGGPR